MVNSEILQWVDEEDLPKLNENMNLMIPKGNNKIGNLHARQWSRHDLMFRRIVKNKNFCLARIRCARAFFLEFADCTTGFTFLNSMFNLMVSMMSGSAAVSLFKKLEKCINFSKEDACRRIQDY